MVELKGTGEETLSAERRSGDSAEAAHALTRKSLLRKGKAFVPISSTLKTMAKQKSKDDFKLARAAVGHTLAKDEMERMQQYLQRGRPYEKLGTPKLRAMFIHAFKERVADLRNPDAWARSNDLQAEYSLRAVEPPFEDLKSELEVMARTAEEMLEGLTPERADEINKEIIDEYLAARRSQN